MMVDAKNYSRNVQKAEIDKFYRDIDSPANSDIQCAAFVSLKTGIAGKADFERNDRAGWLAVGVQAPEGLCGSGEVVAIGTWDLLGKDGHFLEHADNVVLLRRLFDWLAGRC